MKFIFAPDSFKGTLSSAEIIEVLTAKAKEIFPEAETVGVPIADGGEGTIEAVRATAGGECRKVSVKGPLGSPVTAEYLVLEGKKALIEMAAASGLTLIPYQEGNALRTTSFGTGELIRSALDAGIRDLTIAVGGSATNDGGIGMMAALGAGFYDKDGRILEPVGQSLSAIDRIDTRGLHPAAAQAHFTVMCDVKNPLVGKDGATCVFGPQKGANPEQIGILERGMCHYAEKLEAFCGFPVSEREGAGAAGGMGAALMAFCNARLKSGIETVLELVHFEELIRDASLVITGEGKVDGQSCGGKVLDGIGRCAAKYGVPAVAIAGGMGPGAQDIYQSGIGSIMVTENRPMTLEEALLDARALTADAAERMFRLLEMGRRLSS